jgi:hypothetical protein
VDFSHGRHCRISTDCRARRSKVRRRQSDGMLVAMLPLHGRTIEARDWQTVVLEVRRVLGADVVNGHARRDLFAEPDRIAHPNLLPRR